MIRRFLLIVSLATALSFLVGCAKTSPAETSPRIVNIINFIRYTEPRSEAITEEVLYQTVVSQAEDMRSKDLIGTYLLQYDALIYPPYQELMKAEKARGCEIGAWWEITQPHVEASGMRWRGRFPWDWHAHVDFSVGYTQEERQKLVDVYMEKFKEIFGEYPKSVGSWFIDSGTLEYLYEKYSIEASCMCKDQVGTDGYTLWGGYWNGAFYPSRVNGYMPAQTLEGEIPVPVFRMLGSDPIYQYEATVGGGVQTVESLEPAYEGGGGNPAWVDWFFRMFTKEPHMGYNYVQVGQENSFIWARIAKGFVIQTERLRELSDAGEVRIETLLQSARWFKEKYPVTPPTSVITTEDTRGNGLKTIWFNSRNWRANILWDNKGLKFRDIHLFDESLRSEYRDHPDTLPVFRYETLPLVDGCLWSSADNMAGLRLIASGFTGGDPVFSSDDVCQTIVWPSAGGKGKFTIRLTENDAKIESKGVGDWCLELSTVPGKDLPFNAITSSSITASAQDREYGIVLSAGSAEDLRKENPGKVFRLVPSQKGVVEFSFTLKGAPLQGK